ncbi:MAG TPA: hypothetical protein DEP35_03290 [Deltaproteobacteria bacterium]|jgi:hypothetical protein|nr:hypothetical protein [Deltaproteobacteria bacterium]
MKRQAIAGATLGVLIVLGGCAPTNANLTYEHSGPLPRPERVLVYEFAVSPDEVQLDRGLGADAERMAQGTPRTEAELEIGRHAARALANELVKRINSMGLPAERAWGAPGRWGDSLLIEGQFISINQGNRTERTVIGLGTGASDVQTRVQVYETRRHARLERVADFTTEARSCFKPGMAETMGAGAAAGTLAAAAAVSAAGTVASETLSANVQADAERTAKDVADQLQSYFVQQGWISSQ